MIASAEETVEGDMLQKKRTRRIIRISRQWIGRAAGAGRGEHRKNMTHHVRGRRTKRRNQGEKWSKKGAQLPDERQDRSQNRTGHWGRYLEDVKTREEGPEVGFQQSVLKK